MTRAEQETIFRYAADEDVVSVWTAYPPTDHKLRRFGYTPHKVTTREGKAVGWFYKIPLREFRWRAGARKRREQTPAQRQQAAEALKKSRLARNSPDVDRES